MRSPIKGAVKQKKALLSKNIGDFLLGPLDPTTQLDLLFRTCDFKRFGAGDSCSQLSRTVTHLDLDGTGRILRTRSPKLPPRGPRRGGSDQSQTSWLRSQNSISTGPCPSDNDRSNGSLSRPTSSGSGPGRKSAISSAVGLCESEDGVRTNQVWRVGPTSNWVPDPIRYLNRTAFSPQTRLGRAG